MSVQTISPQKTNRSFARRMLLVLLPFVLIPVLLLGSLIYLRTRGVIQDQISLIISEIGQSQTAQIDGWFSKLNNKLSLTAHRPGVVGAYEWMEDSTSDGKPVSAETRQAILAELDTVNQGDLLFNQFILTSPTGEVLLASERGWEGYQLDGVPFYEDLSATHGSQIAVSPGPLFRSGVVSFTSTPVLNAENELVGNLIGITGGARLQQILTSVASFHPQARAYLVSLDGQFIGLDPTITSMTKMAELIPTDEQAAAMQGLIDESTSNQILTFPSFDQQPALSSVHRLSEVDNMLAIELPQQNLLGGLNSLSIFLVAAFLLAAIVLGLLIWGGTRSAVQPLKQLTEAIRDFSPGQSPRLVDVRYEDEIGLLSKTYNKMAGELTTFYQSMEVRVESRSRQIRTAAEIAQLATEATEVDEILQQTVALIVDRFEYDHAAVYLLDPAHKYAILKNASGTAARELLKKGHRLAVGSNSIIGWVTSTNQPRVVNNLDEEPLYYQNELLPLTKSEVGFPISARGEILGALNVQSSRSDDFDQETVASLQILAELIASAILNVRVLETTVVDLQELSALYQVGKTLAVSTSEDDIHRAITDSLGQSTYQYAYYIAGHNGFTLYSFNRLASSAEEEVSSAEPAAWLPTPPGSIPNSEKSIILDTLTEDRQYRDFRNLAITLGWGSLALLPFYIDGDIHSLLILGTKNRNQISPDNISAYIEMLEIAELSLANVTLVDSAQEQQENLATVSQLIRQLADFNPESEDLDSILGDLLAGLRMEYNTRTAAIYSEVPERSSFELRASSGLRSEDVIQTLISIGDGPAGQALEQQSVVTSSNSSDSMEERIEIPVQITAIPIIYRASSLGVLVLETKPNSAFSASDMDLLGTLCNALALIIANDQLIDRQRALYDVTSRISRSAGMAEVMKTTVNELGEILGAKRARLRIGPPMSQEKNSGDRKLNSNPNGS